jgi:hypothetical protein
MPRRKVRSASPRRFFSLRRLFFWTILLVETIWLAGFIWSTGSWIPAGLTGQHPVTALDQTPVWNQTKQDSLDELQIQKLLQREGSQGQSPTAPSPAGRR